MIQVLNADLPLPKHLAGPDEGLRTDGERVMHLRILDKAVINRRCTLAEQDMVRTGGETRHPRGAEPAHRSETEQVPVERFRLLQVVDGNRPVRDAFDMQQTHGILLPFHSGSPYGVGSAPGAASTWSSTRPSARDTRRSITRPSYG